MEKTAAKAKACTGIARAHLLLESFPRSALRPAALLILGDAAAEAAERLTREARRRLDPAEMTAGGAPVASYFHNYNGLDRYRRLGVVFDFDPASRTYYRFYEQKSAYA